MAAAIVRVFIRHGDRTDRKKARLKYVLDAWGFDRFLAEVEKEYGAPLREVSTRPLRAPEPRRPLGARRLPPAEAAGQVSTSASCSRSAG